MARRNRLLYVPADMDMAPVEAAAREYGDLLLLYLGGRR